MKLKCSGFVSTLRNSRMAHVERSALVGKVKSGHLLAAFLVPARSRR